MLSHWVNACVSLNFCTCCCWSLMWHCIFLTGQICNCVAQISELSNVLFGQLMLCFLSGNQVHRFYRKFGLQQARSAVWLLFCFKGWTCEQLTKVHLAFLFITRLNSCNWGHYENLARMCGFLQPSQKEVLPDHFNRMW